MKVDDIGTVLVVGAGTMGQQIAPRHQAGLLTGSDRAS